MPPEIKAQVAAEHARWQNAKAQIDENLKRRGQTVSNLTMPEADKQSQITAIDEATERLRAEMDKAQGNIDAIVAGYSASGAHAPRPTPPGPAPGVGRAGNIPRPGGGGGVEQPSEPQLALIKSQPPGSTVKLSDGSSWIMEPDGNVRRVQ
jgi:hypothetical protein